MRDGFVIVTVEDFLTELYWIGFHFYCGLAIDDIILHICEKEKCYSRFSGATQAIAKDVII
ncbi:MAG: hypothetical protein GPJ18_02485 [Microcystis aeruginosa F13-15]|nr:hypothetical protein [Microcystis aeruginosa F13-15]